MSLTIAVAGSDADIARCWPVMVELRPHIRTPEDLVRLVRLQLDEGYRLAFRADAKGRVVACSGYRIIRMLARGHHMYVDDLVTLPEERSAGHGKAMLDWLADEARRHGCERLQLDSGTHRVDAHRFYHREGMTISAFHFGKPL